MSGPCDCERCREWAALVGEWEDAYIDRAEGTGLWTIADKELQARLDARYKTLLGVEDGASQPRGVTS